MESVFVKFVEGAAHMLEAQRDQNPGEVAWEGPKKIQQVTLKKSHQWDVETMKVTLRSD